MTSPRALFCVLCAHLLTAALCDDAFWSRYMNKREDEAALSKPASVKLTEAFQASTALCSDDRLLAQYPEVGSLCSDIQAAAANFPVEEKVSHALKAAASVCTDERLKTYANVNRLCDKAQDIALSAGKNK